MGLAGYGRVFIHWLGEVIVGRVLWGRWCMGVRCVCCGFSQRGDGSSIVRIIFLGSVHLLGVVM